MKFLIYLIIFAISPTISAQTIKIGLDSLRIDLKYMNKTDSFGKKTGLWYEYSDNYICVEDYKEGKKNGISITYQKVPPKLFSLGTAPFSLCNIGYYCDDIPVNQWTDFYRSGMISGVTTKITENTDFREEARAFYLNNPDSIMQAYAIYYAENGKIEAEGWYIFPYNEMYLDTALDVGIWKYYTSKGIKYRDYSSELLEGLSRERVIQPDMPSIVTLSLPFIKKTTQIHLPPSSIIINR